MGCRVLPVLAVFLAACGGSGGGSGGGGNNPPPPVQPGAFGLTQRVPVTGLTFPLSPPQPGQVEIVDAFPNLSFSNPLFLTYAPEDNSRLFVVEQRGTIQVFSNDSATSTKKTFLDIQSKVTSGNEKGLLGLAFDPDYATNGFFYLNYTSSQGGLHTVIARYKVTSDPDVADNASETILLQYAQPYENHNGGWLGFGPDGYLYIGVGDGGLGGDPQNHAQDKTALLGKILRITKTGGIPSDNPFVGQGGGVREEIWSYGMRNPWRLSFDRDTGDLWCGDVGQDQHEEIDLIVKGGNYGWRLFEGNNNYLNPGVDISTTNAPLLDYPHSDGNCIIGGYVYRGNNVASLRGAYLYGDNGHGTIWALTYDGTSVTSNTVLGDVNSPTSFGEDYYGEVYICSFDGGIYRFAETGGGPAEPLPDKLSATGLFSDTATLTPAPGLIEYGVNAPLWSDGAKKRRWIALPGSSKITFDAENAWTFPLGTVLVKHFELDVLGGTVRLETRALVLEESGWHGYTYRWNAAQTDATLLAGSETGIYSVPDPLAPGGTRMQTWTFPSRTDCLTCHTSAAGRVLGVRTLQLNGDFDYPAATDNQLRSWNNIQLFTTDIGDHAQYGALPNPADTSAAVAARARAYLDSNCAICHRPGGPPPTPIDLRFLTALSSMNVVDIAPTTGDLGLVNARIVASGSKERSALWERIRRTDGSRMPPLGTHVVDMVGVNVIGQWIDGGPQ